MATSNRARPIVQAFLLADVVYQDKRTGKRIIVGTFNRFRIVEFPGMILGGVVYINVTGLHGETPMKLEFRNLRNQQVLMHTTLRVSMGNDPHVALEVDVPVPHFPIPEAGIYAMDLVWNNLLIATLRVTAEEISS